MEGKTVGRVLFLRVLSVCFLSVFAFGVNAQGEAAEGPGRGKLPVWSDQVNFSEVNDMETAGDSLGYIAADRGQIWRTKDKGLTWEKLDTHSDVKIDIIYGEASGIIFAKSSDGFLYSSNYGENWSFVPYKDGYALKTIGYARENQDVVWAAMLKAPGGDRVPGSIMLYISKKRGKEWTEDNWSDAVEVPFMPFLLKPIDDKSAWGYDGRRVMLFTDRGNKSEFVAVSLAREELFVRGTVLGESLVIATTMGRVFRFFRDGSSVELSASDFAGHGVIQFSTYLDGSASAVDSQGLIYLNEQVLSGEWHKRGGFEAVPAMVYGWPGGAFLFKTTSGGVRSKTVADNREHVIKEVPVGSPKGFVAAKGGLLFFYTDKGEVFASEDHGENWEFRIKDPSGVTHLAVGEDHFVVRVAGDGTAFYSKDKGVTWSPLAQLSTSGGVARLLVENKDNVVVEVRTNEYPYGGYKLFRFSEGNGVGTFLRSSDDMQLVGYVGDGNLKGMLFNGDFVELKNGNEWSVIKSDLFEKVKAKTSKEIKSTNVFQTWSWLNANQGWVGGFGGALYTTRDAGKTWEALEVPADLDIKKLYFFDKLNGILYGMVTHDQIVESYGTTNDGGVTWHFRDVLGDGEFKDFSIAPDGTGILGLTTGITYITRLAVAPELEFTVSSSPLGKVSFNVTTRSEKAEPLLNGTVSAMAVRWRINGLGPWRRAEVNMKDVKYDERGGLGFEWSSALARKRIAPGSSVDFKIDVDTKDGAATTLMTKNITYLSWVVRYRDAIVMALWVLSAVAIVALGVLAVWIFYPVLLVRFLRQQQAVVAALLKVLPGFIASLLSLLLILNPIERLAMTKRVRNAWVKRYKEGQESLGDLCESLLPGYLEKSDLLDVWVEARLDKCREHLQAQRKMLGISVYVPIGVQLTTDNVISVAPSPSASSFREYFSLDRVVVGLIGDGGTGKTTLAGQMGEWAMRSDASKRLIPEATAIAVFLSGEVTNVLQAIRDELLKVDNQQEDAALCDVVLQAAMRRKRLVVIFDGLSESSEQTQSLIKRVFVDLKISLFIVTGRRPYPQILDRWVQVTPDQVTPGSVNRFLSQYIHDSGLENQITPDEQLALSGQLLRLLEKRPTSTRLPPLFLVLYVQNLLSENQNVPGPTTVAATVQRYVRNLSPAQTGLFSDPDMFAKLATILAWNSLQPNFIPSEFDVDLAIRSLSPEVPDPKAREIIRAMISSNLLIEKLGVAGMSLRFRLDPVAEYLAAIQSAKYLSTPESWQAHMHDLTLAHAPEGAALGYIVALFECIQSIGAKYNVPVWVHSELKTLGSLE